MAVLSLTAIEYFGRAFDSVVGMSALSLTAIRDVESEFALVVGAEVFMVELCLSALEYSGTDPNDTSLSTSLTSS
jgi:hypothetical protein